MLLEQFALFLFSMFNTICLIASSLYTIIFTIFSKTPIFVLFIIKCKRVNYHFLKTWQNDKRAKLYVYQGFKRGIIKILRFFERNLKPTATPFSTLTPTTFPPLFHHFSTVFLSFFPKITLNFYPNFHPQNTLI